MHACAGDRGDHQRGALGGQSGRLAQPRAIFALIERWPISAVTLEILHRSLMLLGRRPRLEGAEVPALAGLRILLARVQTILACLQFPNHGKVLVVAAFRTQLAFRLVWLAFMAEL